MHNTNLYHHSVAIDVLISSPGYVSMRRGVLSEQSGKLLLLQKQTMMGSEDTEESHPPP